MDHRPTPVPPSPTVPRLRIGRAWLTLCTMAQALAQIDGALRGERGLRIVTPNLSHLVLLETDERFRRVYEQADLQLVDSTPMRWLTRLSRSPAPERVAGSDLFPQVLALAHGHGSRVMVIGGSAATAEAAALRVEATLPGLAFRVLTPPQGFDASPAELEAVKAQVRCFAPDVLAVCVGTPRSELLGQRLAADHPRAIIGSFGAAIDFFAGTKPRAPQVLQRLGLEWAHRVMTEPRRLAPRYLRTALGLPPVLVRIAAAAVRSRRTTLARPGG